MNSIKITSDWEYDEDCAGRSVPEECNLRESEMELVVYAPELCLDEDIEGC